MSQLSMRAFLVVAAHEREVARALTSGADGLIFDLTQADSAERAARRAQVLAALLRVRAGANPPSLYVRLEDLGDGGVDADLDAVMPGRPDGILFANPRDGADVQHLSVKLAVREAEHGWADGDTKILAAAPATPAAAFRLGSYIGASARLAGLVFASGELLTALGATQSTEAKITPPFLLARGLTLLAAKAANVAAIDLVLASGSDESFVRHACAAARHDGFSGMIVADPEHVGIIRGDLGDPR